MSEVKECTTDKKEVWKPVKGFKGHYEVSNKGRVKSLKGRGVNIRKKTKDAYGYHVMVLTKMVKGKCIRKHCKVHRLVAEAFIPNLKDLDTVNHKNCIKTDNRIENLEWMTFGDNTIHGFDNDRMIVGEDHYKAKLTENDVLDILNSINLGCFGRKEIAKAYNVHVSTITHIIKGDSWKKVQF